MIRKIHLDFHTHPDTRGIGASFCPEAFAATLADAHVNYLATPGKCHFGHLYYRSDVGRVHPHLADPEMFSRTVAACAAHGIRTQAYWTLGLDAWAATQHPAWRQTFADGSFANWGDYLHMCFASPYIDELVIPEVVDCLDRCPGIVGFWFDIALYVDGAFHSRDFERLARERLGGQAESADARWQLGRQLIAERCRQLDAAIKAHLPEAENYFNSLVDVGEPENLAIQPLQEVENPILFQTAEKLTVNVRWLRGHAAPTIGLVSRFQGPWSDPGTLRTADQMRFDVARTVALGCHVSMGDHRYPDGRLEPEVYRRLGPIYTEVAALDPWLASVHPVREAILLGPVERGSGKGLLFPRLSPLTTHAARLLEAAGIQFDILSEEDELPAVELIVWPGERPASPALLARLRRHLERGGSLLAMDAAIDGAADLLPATRLPWTPPPPLATVDSSTASIGHVASAPAATDAAGPSDQFVRMRRGVFAQILTRPCRLIAASDGAETLADRYAPVSAKPPFAAAEPSGPMIVQRSRVIYSAAPLIAEAAATGSPVPGEILAELCDRLLPNRRIRHDGGATVAAHLHEGERGYLLHLVQWALDRWGEKVNSAPSFPRLGPIRVDLAADHPIQRVRLLPTGDALEHEQTANRCRFTLPTLHIWQAIALER